MDLSDLSRLHRFIEAQSLTGGYNKMRRALQQREDGCINHAARGRKDKDAYGAAISGYRMAVKQEIWPCC